MTGRRSFCSRSRQWVEVIVGAEEKKGVLGFREENVKYILLSH